MWLQRCLSWRFSLLSRSRTLKVSVVVTKVLMRGLKRSMKPVRPILLTLVTLTALATRTLGGVVSAAPGRAEIQRLRWKGRTIRIDISSSLTRPNINIKYGSDVAGAIERSIHAWE